MAKIIDTNALLFFWLDLKSKFAGKVDKETGKSLVSDTEIAKLATLANYDDTEVLAHIENLGIHVTSADKARWDAAATGGIPPEYVTDTELAAVLEDYMLESGMDSYTTDAELTAAIANFVTSSSLATTLSTYAKTVDLNGYYTKTEVDAKLTSAVTYKSTVANWSALPSTGQKVGDMYNVTAASANNRAGDNVVWNGTGWDVQAGTVDLTGYLQTSDIATNSDIETILAS